MMVAVDLNQLSDDEKAKLEANQAHADALRAERDALKEGYSDLVNAGDREEIARRSIRRGEIDRELARLGA